MLASLDKIVDDGLCLGCGLCAAVAGSEAIEMGRGTDGDLRPFAKDGLNDDDVALINQICPSLRIEGLPEALQAEATYHDLIWGPYEDMMLAHATHEDVRYEASTAGILTALGLMLLETGKVDAILHVKAADSPANFGQATLSRSAADVRAAAGSRYGPTAALATIDEVLDSNEAIAVIAKPCDLNALRNLAHHDKRVNETIHYWLTMICGGFQPDASFRDFVTSHGLTADEISKVRYRGYGCPGPTTIASQDQVMDFHYLDFWGEDESQWSMPLRCKICADGIGEAADIAAGDAWDGASPDRMESLDDPGFNSVISRTAAGQALLNDAMARGYITKTEDVGPDFMSQVQPHQVAKKKAGLARMQGLKDAGSVAPEIVNMRAEALSDLLDNDAYHSERDGAKRRANAARSSTSDT